MERGKRTGIKREQTVEGVINLEESSRVEDQSKAIVFRFKNKFTTSICKIYFFMFIYSIKVEVITDFKTEMPTYTSLITPIS